MGCESTDDTTETKSQTVVGYYAWKEYKTDIVDFGWGGKPTVNANKSKFGFDYWNVKIEVRVDAAEKEPDDKKIIKLVGHTPQVVVQNGSSPINMNDNDVWKPAVGGAVLSHNVTELRTEPIKGSNCRNQVYYAEFTVIYLKAWRISKKEVDLLKVFKKSNPHRDRCIA